MTKPTAPFVFVDVFAESPMTGNPLSLVPDADGLDDHQMRAIAREFNQSETTFVLTPSRPGVHRHLRSFTPNGSEVMGAGHNALGAWVWLAAAGLLGEPGPDGVYVQQIGDALLPVEVDTSGPGPAVVTMDQLAPRFGRVVTDRPGLAEALGLTESDLGPADAQVVSTGAGHLLVELADAKAVDAAAPDAPRLAAALRRVEGEGCLIYSRPADGPTAAYSRFFNPTMGIHEDPATGSAAGPLAARLIADGTVAAGEVVIEQGHAIGRPSRLTVHVAGGRVRLSGSGLVVAEGRFVPPVRLP